MAVQLQETRPVSAEQWQKALTRAIDEALDVLIEPISGEAFVESATTPGTLYQVSASSCSCPAGQRGLVCKHRAAYLFQIGEIPVDIVSIGYCEHGAPAGAFCGRCQSHVVPCSSCTNGKTEEWGVSGPIGSTPCTVCGGSGIKPDHRLHDAPLVQPVAAAA